MPQGLWVSLSNGKEFSSDMLGCVFVESFTVAAGATGSKLYPKFVGVNLAATQIVINAAITNVSTYMKMDAGQWHLLNLVWSLEGNVPKLSWTREPIYTQLQNKSVCQVLVFTRRA